MMNKKGDLSLSTNAIVVLLMAIIVLGFGIGFTQGMFKDLEIQLRGQTNEPDAPGATASRPLTTSKGEEFHIEAGDSSLMKISVYNPTAGPWSGLIVSITEGCGAVGDTMMKTVDPYEANSMRFFFEAPTGSGAKLCVLKVGTNTDGTEGEHYVSQDFTMYVE